MTIANDPSFLNSIKQSERAEALESCLDARYILVVLQEDVAAPMQQQCYATIYDDASEILARLAAKKNAAKGRFILVDATQKTEIDYIANNFLDWDNAVKIVNLHKQVKVFDFTALHTEEELRAEILRLKPILDKVPVVKGFRIDSISQFRFPVEQING